MSETSKAGFVASRPIYVIVMIYLQFTFFYRKMSLITVIYTLGISSLHNKKKKKAVLHSRPMVQNGPLKIFIQVHTMHFLVRQAVF